MSFEEPNSFPSLHSFLTLEIATLLEARGEATFGEKRVIDKKLKPLKALLAKANEVRGK